MKYKRKIIYQREEFGWMEEKETLPADLKGIDLDIYEEYTDEILRISYKIANKLRERGLKKVGTLVLTMLVCAICEISFKGIKKVERKRVIKWEVIDLMNNIMNYLLQGSAENDKE